MKSPKQKGDVNTMFERKPITKEQQMSALREAVRLWRMGKYKRAVDLYQRYGITDRQFSQALVGLMHSEDK